MGFFFDPEPPQPGSESKPVASGGSFNKPKLIAFNSKPLEPADEERGTYL